MKQKQLTTAEKQKQLKNLAKQAKRQLALQNRKKRLQEDIPDSPILLSLTELSQKTNLPYLFVRRMVIDENIVPYFKVGRKYIVNYNLFLETMNKREV